MTVVYKASDRTFKAHDVLWAKQELVDAIVRQALVDQTEGFIDMILDGQEDMSRNGINETLRGVPDCAHDVMRDMLSDLERAIMQRMKEVLYGASVTGLKFDLAGDVTDIEVDVTVNFEEKA
jgi:hypothetical protein